MNPPRYLLLEFEAEEEIVEAAHILMELGPAPLDAMTPHPVAKLEQAMRMPRSVASRWGGAFAVLGAALGFGVQWYCNAYDYPLNAGGRPAFAIPAFIPIAFESMVLVAGVGVFAVFLLLSGLPCLSHPVFDVEGIERASVDRYWLVVDRPRDFSADDLARRLKAVPPLRVVPYEGGRS